MPVSDHLPLAGDCLQCPGHVLAAQLAAAAFRHSTRKPSAGRSPRARAGDVREAISFGPFAGEALPPWWSWRQPDFRGELIFGGAPACWIPRTAAPALVYRAARPSRSCHARQHARCGRRNCPGLLPLLPHFDNPLTSNAFERWISVLWICLRLPQATARNYSSDRAIFAPFDLPLDVFGKAGFRENSGASYSVRLFAVFGWCPL